MISRFSFNTCEKYQFVITMRFLLILATSSAAYRIYTNEGFDSDVPLSNYNSGVDADSDLSVFQQQKSGFYSNVFEILKNSSMTSFEINDGNRCNLDLRVRKKASDIRGELDLIRKLLRNYEKSKNFRITNGSGKKNIFTHNRVNNKKDGEGEYHVGYSSDPFGRYEQYVQNVTEGVISTNPVYSSNDSERPRGKRSVVNLYYMVKCATKCNPMSYLGYGCYCGLSGTGKPVDFIDRCCQIHDQCYGRTGCLYLKEYLMPYLWKCRKHQPECATSHGIFGGPGSCADRLCQCDRKFSECVRKRKCPVFKPKCSSSSVLETKRKMKAMKEELIRKIEEDLKEEEKLRRLFTKEEADIKSEKRKGFIQRLQLERREAGLDGVVLKAQEVAKVQENEIRQEERLAAEMSLIRQKEIVDEKLRQQLRQNSHELKDLERQLKAAYGNKILAAQIAENQAQKIHDQMMEQKTRKVLLKALGSEEERERAEMMHEKEMKEKYRCSLQDQIIEKERLRQEEYLAYLKEKKIFEDTFKKIKEEEERENLEKLIMKEKIKEEMEQFYAARELWKARERILIDKENQKLESIIRMKEEAEAKKKQQYPCKEERDNRIQQIITEINSQKQLKEDRRELMDLLRDYEAEEREKYKAQIQLENALIANREAKHQFKQLLAEKDRKAQEEKELNARFAEQMNLKTQEEERSEKEKEDRRRLNRVNDRIYNEGKIKHNIQKRAESLKLAQLAVEIEEKEERKRLEMIEEERIRILREHAPNLIGYFPKGCLKEKDLEILGLTGNSPSTEAVPSVIGN